jgi:hypothetical protein
MTKYYAPRIVQEESVAILSHPYITEAAVVFDISEGDERSIDTDIAERAMARLAWVGHDMAASPEAIFHAMSVLAPNLVAPPRLSPPEFA